MKNKRSAAIPGAAESTGGINLRCRFVIAVPLGFFEKNRENRLEVSGGALQ